MQKKASARLAEWRRVEASTCDCVPRAKEQATDSAHAPSGQTWVPAEDADPLLPAQSVAGICAEGGGRIAGHQSVMERSVLATFGVVVASSDFLRCTDVVTVNASTGSVESKSKT